MNKPEKRKSRIAEEMESKLEDRDEARLETERSRLKDVMQGMQDPGSHVTARRGINWGPSYRTRRKAAQPKQHSNKDSDAKT
jgi:hypothetical protein